MNVCVPGFSFNSDIVVVSPYSPCGCFRSPLFLLLLWVLFFSFLTDGETILRLGGRRKKSLFSFVLRLEGGKKEEKKNWRDANWITMKFPPVAVSPNTVAGGRPFPSCGLLCGHKAIIDQGTAFVKMSPRRQFSSEIGCSYATMRWYQRPACVDVWNQRVESFPRRKGEIS